MSAARLARSGLIALLIAASPILSARAAAETDAYRVADFVARTPEAGTFTLVAFVTSVYRCPPCPPGAQCKPCIGDHVTLADEPRGSAKELMVFAARAEIAKFEPGRRYRFRVELRAGASASARLNDVRLREAEPMP